MFFWEKILWEGKSPNSGKIKVTEGGGIRRLVVDGLTQSRSLSKDGKTSFYWDSFLENLPPLTKEAKILILGLGAGTTAKIFTDKFGPITIHGVEIDPLIVELGKKYFYLREPNIKIFVEDAGKFVSKTRDNYNVVCVDLFHGDKTPQFITSKEFLETVKERLFQNGVIIVNKICNDRAEDENFVRAIASVFPDYLISREKGNKYQQNVIFYGRR